MTNNDDFESFYNVLYSYCRGEQYNHEELLDMCKQILVIPKFSNMASYVEKAVNRYEVRCGAKTFVPGTTLSIHKSDDSWLYKRKDEMNDDDHAYENRYRNFLTYQSQYNKQSVDYIMSEAENILSYCADPNNENCDKKLGLVMGDVQSGKTSNYLALANMAFDYGYKIVLILSGVTESLRVQTQKRVDKGLVGAVSSTIGGLVEYNGLGGENKYYAIPLTDDEGDFRQINCSTDDLKLPQIIVAKKNKSVLEKIKLWLKPGGDEIISGKNILIIDDECDNASVNTRKDYDPTTINRLIREIFNNFDCATYVGYTATPFANIFINSDDDPDKLKELFPRDFIHRLKTTNETYFGIDKVFRSNGEHVSFLDLDDPLLLLANHKRDAIVSGLPESMKDAICTFLLCNCIRTLRDDVFDHRTMMINVSRFNDVQLEYEHYVGQYVDYLKKVIFQYDHYTDSQFVKNAECKRIYDIYKNDSMFDLAKAEGFDFDTIKGILNQEIDQFCVIVLNDKNPKVKLDYGQEQYKYGARLIVIGGFTLSRGLTLEGLMISYYHRNSITYDTLLQMCRWFGYRPNYEDLCKIYMSENNYNNFETVVDAIDNLDEQIEVMNSRGATPGDYGLMIMQSPDILETTLLITARNKTRNAKSLTLSLNFSGADIDTPHLYMDIDTIEKNAMKVSKFIESLARKGYHLENPANWSNRNLYKDIPCELISDFIGGISIPPQNRKFIIENLTSFIAKGEHYSKWDVVFATGDPKDGGETYEINDGEEKTTILMPHRTFAFETGSNVLSTSVNNHNRLNDPGLFNSGLTSNQLNEAQDIADARTGSAHAKPIAKDYLAVRDRNPLLIIYPIMLKADTSPKDKTPSPAKQEIIDDIKNHNTTLYGFGIGFPGKTEEGIVTNYLVNDIKLKEMFEVQDNDLEDVDDD